MINSSENGVAGFALLIKKRGATIQTKAQVKSFVYLK